MTNELGIWHRVTENLRSKYSGTEIENWFSQTSLSSLGNNNTAVVEVPNKFIANWLRDKYLDDIKNSFKSILNETPDIQFKYVKTKYSKLPQKREKEIKDDTYAGKNLNTLMTFDSFITGDCNQFAYSSALEVSERPGGEYNPLYIFGTGKTHLLNAIGNHIHDSNPGIRIKYLYSKTLISDFNASIKNRTFDSFWDDYLNLDILLFDDIHNLSNRTRLQDGFLSLFNSLYANDNLIAISGDRPPNMLKNINPRLKSRLGGGLIAEIKDVDYETKYKIINKKINDLNIILPNDIISFLVKNNNDLKILLKNIIRLETYISLNGSNNINLSLVKSIIKNRVISDIGVKEINSITSGFFNISVADLISYKKKKVYSYPRHLAMYLCRKYTNLSYQEIGYNFGDRDHSTVLYAVKKIEKIISKNSRIKEDLKNLENLLT